MYTTLYEQATHLLGLSGLVSESISGSPADTATFSYNLALTSQVMVLCPRLAEGAEVVDINGNRVGDISLNGTLLGGALLVKSEDQWNALHGDEAQLGKVLQGVGFSPSLLKP